MKCPNCGQELKDELKRVPQPMPFSSPERLLKKGRLTERRIVYECIKCERFYIRTIALVEIPASDVE